MLKDLNPQELTLSAIVVAMFFTENLDLEDIDSWGNWFSLVGRYLETYAAFSNNQARGSFKVHNHFNNK